MSCTTKENTIQIFINEGYIKERNREILNLNEFKSANERYTKLMKNNFNIDRNDQLFSISVGERTSLRSRTVLRAVPNEDFFKLIEDSKVTLEEPVEDTSEPTMTNLPKPGLGFEFLSVEELIAQEDPVKSKILQDEIEQESKELQDLINCLWTS